jgi:hypothetical protein
LKHDVSDKGRCTDRIRLALIKAFIAEYSSTIGALTLLCILSAYAVQTQRLFEFLVFVVMALQLELAYRQWWLEAGKHKAKLEVRRVYVSENRDALTLYVVNTGNDVAYHVEIPFLIIPLSMYIRLLALFSLQPALFKRLAKLLVLCAGCGGGTAYEFASLQPGAQHAFTADLSVCLKDYSRHDIGALTVFAGVCREALYKPFSQCDAYIIVILREPIMVLMRPLERELPGVLTRIPNMISDLALVVQYLRQSINP